MVIFEQVLRDLIVATNLFERRVFLLRAPQVPAEQQKTPYAVFLPTGPSPIHAQTGPLVLQDRTYQVSIFDESQTKALAIAESLKNALDGWKGTYEGVDFGGIFLYSSSWEYEPASILFHITVEFRILYRLIDPQPQTAVTNRSTDRKTIRSYNTNAS